MDGLTRRAKCPLCERYRQMYSSDRWWACEGCGEFGCDDCISPFECDSRAGACDVCLESGRVRFPDNDFDDDEPDHATISVKRLTPTATLPTRAHPTDAGLDLYHDLAGFSIEPGMTVKVRTGISLAIDDGFFGLTLGRSSINANGIGVLPGVIDSSYRGELKVVLHNHSNKNAFFLPKERIAQLVIMPCITPRPIEVEQLDATDRGEGGFGSTGSH